VTSCPHCSRESDRLAPLLTSRLAEIDRALGLPAHSLQGERRRRAEDLAALAAVVDTWIQAEKLHRALGGDFKLRLAAMDAKRAMLVALAKVRQGAEESSTTPELG
jgi:hypothetical protein